MKRKIFELFIVFFVFLSCGNKSEVFDYSKFKIATKKISAPEDVIFGMVTDDNFIVCSQPREACTLLWRTVHTSRENSARFSEEH